MHSNNTVLVTGGNGLLGTALKKIYTAAIYTDIDDFNITDFVQMDNFLSDKKVSTILHAAAFTSPPKINEDPVKAIEANIIGTSNVVKIAAKYDIRLIYICTDYVFKGDRGNYKEDDEVFPQNKYAWSKLGGECAVRLYDKSLIIRTTFGPDEFPYPKAFVDQWTSRESVSVTASMIVKIIEKDDLFGTIHIGGNRKTVMDYARKISPEKHIEELRLAEVDFNPPRDTSLDISLFNKLFN